MKYRVHFDRKSFVFTLCFGLAVFLVARPAASSIVVDMDLEDLVRESDSIVQGVVESVSSEWGQR